MLRTLAIVSNQIMLSFGVFDSFLITKAIQDWGKFYRIQGKLNGSSFTRRIQALELHSPLPKVNQECKEGKQREKSNMKKFKRTATLRHISSTFWSPFYAYHMSFRSSGSQESNASNGAQSWNEEVMAIGSKSQQVERQFRKLRNHKVLVAKSAFLCEMETFSLRDFAAHVACCEIHLSAFWYLQQTLLDFFLQIFVV